MFKKTRAEHFSGAIPVTQGQMQYEWKHLLAKLERRNPGRYKELVRLEAPLVHPLFRVVSGEVEKWERTDERYGIGDKAKNRLIIAGINERKIY